MPLNYSWSYTGTKDDRLNYRPLLPREIIGRPCRHFSFNMLKSYAGPISFTCNTCIRRYDFYPQERHYDTLVKVFNNGYIDWILEGNAPKYQPWYVKVAKWLNTPLIGR